MHNSECQEISNAREVKFNIPSCDDDELKNGEVVSFRERKLPGKLIRLKALRDIRNELLSQSSTSIQNQSNWKQKRVSQTTEIVNLAHSSHKDGHAYEHKNIRNQFRNIPLRTNMPRANVFSKQRMSKYNIRNIQINTKPIQSEPCTCTSKMNDDILKPQHQMLGLAVTKKELQNMGDGKSQTITHKTLPLLYNKSGGKKVDVKFDKKKQKYEHHIEIKELHWQNHFQNKTSLKKQMSNIPLNRDDTNECQGPSPLNISKEVLGYADKNAYRYKRNLKMLGSEADVNKHFNQIFARSFSLRRKKQRLIEKQEKPDSENELKTSNNSTVREQNVYFVNVPCQIPGTCNPKLYSSKPAPSNPTCKSAKCQDRHLFKKYNKTVCTGDYTPSSFYKNKGSSVKVNVSRRKQNARHDLNEKKVSGTCFVNQRKPNEVRDLNKNEVSGACKVSYKTCTCDSRKIWCKNKPLCVYCDKTPTSQGKQHDSSVNVLPYEKYICSENAKRKKSHKINAFQHSDINSKTIEPNYKAKINIKDDILEQHKPQMQTIHPYIPKKSQKSINKRLVKSSHKLPNRTANTVSYGKHKKIDRRIKKQGNKKLYETKTLQNAKQKYKYRTKSETHISNSVNRRYILKSIMQHLSNLTFSNSKSKNYSKNSNKTQKNNVEKSNNIKLKRQRDIAVKSSKRDGLYNRKNIGSPKASKGLRNTKVSTTTKIKLHKNNMHMHKKMHDLSRFDYGVAASRQLVDYTNNKRKGSILDNQNLGKVARPLENQVFANKINNKREKNMTNKNTVSNRRIKNSVQASKDKLISICKCQNRKKKFDNGMFNRLYNKKRRSKNKSCFIKSNSINKKISTKYYKCRDKGCIAKCLCFDKKCSINKICIPKCKDAEGFCKPIQYRNSGCICECTIYNTGKSKGGVNSINTQHRLISSGDATNQEIQTMLDSTKSMKIFNRLKLSTAKIICTICKISPCFCRRKVSSKKLKKLRDDSMTARIPIKYCRCGSPISIYKSKKMSSLTSFCECGKAAIERVNKENLIKKQDAICDAKTKKRLKDAKTRQRKKRISNKKDKKLDEQQLREYKNYTDTVLVGESVLDVAKLGIDAGVSVVKCTTKAIVDPKCTYYKLRRAFRQPKRVLHEIKHELSNSELFPTAKRIKNRIRATETFRDTKFKMENHPTTYFFIHMLDGKKRLTFKRRRPRRKRIQLDFQCDLYISSLRRKQCLYVYNTCPWFYPQCISLLRCWKEIINIFLFILAVGVWSPCIIAVELCRALLCCFFCTG